MSAEKLLYRNDTLHGHGADINFAWQTGGSAALLATTGSDGTVAILNRSGQLQQRLVLPSNGGGGGNVTVCADFAWDADGDLLAVISAGVPQLLLWDANTGQQHIIDVGLRDALTCVCWARGASIAAHTGQNASSTIGGGGVGPLLAVGSARGNVAIYNHQTARRTPILGKHAKRITCAAWSAGAQILAMASEDRTLSLSSATGDSLRTVALRDVPADMQFAAMKTDAAPSSTGGSASMMVAGGGGDGVLSAATSMAAADNTVSLILGRRTLYLYHLPEPDGPTELGFQAKYGALVQHRWFGDGYILLGFANGYAVAISTHAREVGQELWQVRNHRDQLTAVAVSPAAIGFLASAGADGTVKVHATDNLKETVSIVTLPGGGVGSSSSGVAQGVRSVAWSTDGQLMAVSTQQGGLFVFVTQLPTLFAVAGARVAVLTSLAEVTLYPDVRTTSASALTKLMMAGQAASGAVAAGSDVAIARPAHIVPLEIEPTFVALGPRHLAGGMNNHVWFYELGRLPADVPMLLGDREYLAEIASVGLNTHWCAVLCGGQVMLDAIESSATATTTSATSGKKATRQPQVFPSSVHGMHESVITCTALTEEFLVFATDLGNVVFFALNSWMPVIRWRHSMGIKRMFSDADGTKLVLIDDHNDGYVFLPASEDLVHIVDFPKTCTGVLWDGAQPNVFIVCSERHCSTFVFVKHSVHGRHIVKVPPATALLSGQQPIVLYDGDLILTAPNGNGRLAAIRLATHKPQAAAGQDVEIVRKAADDTSESTATAFADELGTVLLLRRHADAWSLCRTLNSRIGWKRLGRAALGDLDVSLALRAFRQASSIPAAESSNTDAAAATMMTDESTSHDCTVAMVLALQDIQHIEDSAYIAGTCALLLDRPDRAKGHFARSCRPLEALELCRDLLQWEQAMSLAETLAPDQLAGIAAEYAQQLEDAEQCGDALQQYERARGGGDDDDELTNTENGDPKVQVTIASHRRLCDAGIARTSIANGDAQRGLLLVQRLFEAGRCDSDLLVDCADALLRHHGGTHRDAAAGLLERAGAWERACRLYVEQKQWHSVAVVLPRCLPGAAKLHAAYAAAMEAAGDYEAAVRAYTTAGDLDACVRVHLERLSDPHAAGEIVLSTRSVEGGRQLAAFYQQIGDTEQALQFLVLCGSLAEALRLARRHTKMERYAELLDGVGSGAGGVGAAVTTADWRAVAEHFETERHSLLAGKYWCRAGECGRALRLLLRAAQARMEDEAQALQLAIECVARAQDDRLAEQLIGFLLGDGGDGSTAEAGGGSGMPRDPKYLFRLYMARGQLREAAKTAVIVAQQEQQAGNYRAAHGMLLGMCQELRRNGLAVGGEMREQLVLLHRYALVRLHVKLGEHGRAARLLCEVAKSIGQFPAHIVPILTSTVVECQRAGLTTAAYQHAAQLMRSEYRSQIDPKYAKKIEAIVRKAPRDIRTAAAAATAAGDSGDKTMPMTANGKDTEMENGTTSSSSAWSPCPVCEEPLATMQTVCQQCRSTVPICIATGEHITSADLSACPECDFPCFRAAMQRILDLTNQCPMCSEIVDSNRLAESVEPTVYLSSLASK